MDASDLAARVIAGDRRALARAITVVESTRGADRAAALVLAGAAAATGRQALRIGLSGAPGVGKSSLVETLGLMLTARGLRLAVLAVDPSSVRGGGAILGDKTRMERLARDPRAFIRPSPGQAGHGGIARRTRDAVLLCEAAGFDVVLVETVGVGQSETLVADVTDLFVLMLAPGAGDDLQGVKRGIMERADLILVNKADGGQEAAAERTRSDHAAALRLMRPRPADPEGGPQVLCVSALEGKGLHEAWDAMTALADWRRERGHFAARRKAQARAWFEAEVREELLARLTARPDLRRAMVEVGAAVEAGEISPDQGVARIVGMLP